jgi:hypothetical protein
MQSVTQTLARHKISAGPIDLRGILYERKVTLPAFLARPTSGRSESTSTPTPCS